MPRERKMWTEEEDEILREATTSQFQNGARKNWHIIAEKLPERTNKDCRKRWSKVSWERKRGSWDAGEDQRLQLGIQRHGHRWTLVAQVVSTRTSERRSLQAGAHIPISYSEIECSKRWQHSLDPTRDRSAWTAEEDERLVAAIKTHGQNWKLIEDNEFPERTRTGLTNRYAIINRRCGSQKSSKVSLQSIQSTADKKMDILMESARNDKIPAEDDWMDLLAAPTPFQDEDYFPSYGSTIPTYNIATTAENSVAGDSLFPALDMAFLDFDPEQHQHTYVERSGKRDFEGNDKSAAQLVSITNEYVQQDTSFLLDHDFSPSGMVFSGPGTPSRWGEIDHALEGCFPTSTDSNTAEIKEASSPGNEVDAGDTPDTLLPAGKKSRQTTLVLEDATPDTMYSLLEILFRTDTKMTMNFA